MSNDNPFSDPLLKTAMYHHAHPGGFASLTAAAAYPEPFFGWCNQEQHHSGERERVQAVRQAALDEGHRRHCKRLVRGRPRPPQVPAIVALNLEPGLRVQPVTTPAATPA